MTQILPNHPGIDERNSEITRLRAEAEQLKANITAQDEKIMWWLRSDIAAQATISRLRAELAASAEALERAVAAERERIIDRLEYEASMLPCFEDAESTRENAMLIRADFSYEELDRLKDERDVAAKRAREASKQ